MNPFKTLGAICAFIFSLSTLVAQTDAEFEAFGQLVFTSLTDTVQDKPVEFVRIKTLHDLINEQPISNKEKEIRHQQVEDEYNANYEVFVKRQALLKKKFMRELMSGTRYEMLAFEHEAEMTNIYSGTIRYLYEMSTVRALATMRFRFFYNGKGFGLMGPVEVEY